MIVNETLLVARIIHGEIIYWDLKLVLKDTETLPQHNNKKSCEKITSEKKHGNNKC